MSNTSNQIKEADQKVRTALDELIEIEAKAMAREIIEEFTVEIGKSICDIDEVDFENRVIRINGRLV